MILISKEIAGHVYRNDESYFRKNQLGLFIDERLKPIKKRLEDALKENGCENLIEGINDAIKMLGEE